MTFRDEKFAPEVDESLLRALVRRELSEEKAVDVYRLIYSFQSWNDEHTRILIEEFRRISGDVPDEPADSNGQ